MARKTLETVHLRSSEPTVPMMVRVTVEDLAQLDAWIAQNGPPYVTRPEAVRRLVRGALAKAGCGDRPD